VRALVALAIAVGAAQGMDLATDTACWAPIAADTGEEYSPGCAKWYLDDHDFVSTRYRLDGTRVVARETSQFDGQFAVGYLSYREFRPNGYIHGGTWHRAHLRAGTDPLAGSFRSLLVTGGYGYGALPGLAVSCDAGYSSHRGLVGSIEAWLVGLHLAGERDEINGTMRTGLGLRVPGSTSAWSGAIAIDYLRGWSTDSGTALYPRFQNAANAAVNLAWSPVNRLLVTGDVTVTSNAWLGGRNEALVVCALGFGAGF
jgi:hypothetical protein